MKSQLSKIIFVALFAGLVSIFGAVSANAQSPFKFETSFGFNVGKDKFNAGKYELTHLTFTRYLLRNTESKETRIVLFELTGRTDETVESLRLTFNRYGNTYFLRGLFERPDAAGKQMIESSTEKRLRKGGSGAERLAKVDLRPKKVSVDLNR